MPAIEALGRISEIRAAIAELSAAPVARLSAAAPSGSAVSSSAVPSSAAGFAGVLAGLESTDTAGQVPLSGSQAALAQQVTAAAEKYIGLPYVWGGNDPAVGLDCSSFVQNVFKDLGYSLPRVTYDQINQGRPVASLAQAQPGDLLFTHNTGHVAIYLGNGKAVDAPQPGQTIQIRDAWENDSNITGIRRILPDADAGAAPAPDLAGVIASAQASLLAGAR
ncbi:MAG: C40 family peptidase [Arthrobacter sp.]